MSRLNLAVRPFALVSFRRALAVAGVVMGAALAAMATIMTVGLGRADDLLDRLSRSQDQLAQVTRIEADINRLQADVATGRNPAATRAEAAAVSDRLQVYRRSVTAESRRLGPTPNQAGEADNAERLSLAFEAMRTNLPAEGARGRFDALTRHLVDGERQEAREAIDSMRRLRRQITWLGIGIPLIVGILGAMGAWLMLAGTIRPLRTLEAAAELAGRGDDPAPVRVRGFTEFQTLARTFNQMGEQIAAQRIALFEINRGLEAQVEERTRQIRIGQEKLAEVDRTRRLFFSQIGHELRTPATVIRGEAEVALRDPHASARRLREALEHVVANGAFLQRRLEDMLALAQAEDGRIALRREPVDLAAMVRGAAALAEPYVRSSQTTLTADIAEASGPIILGDASWLQQALLALVDNAAKFAGDRTPIRLSLKADGGSALIAVADGGSGVDETELPFLFDSYYQAPSGRARGGSGLGLSIARWVAEQHGGSIKAFNARRRGLVIEIRLPTTT